MTKHPDRAEAETILASLGYAEFFGGDGEHGEYAAAWTRATNPQSVIVIGAPGRSEFIFTDDPAALLWSWGVAEGDFADLAAAMRAQPGVTTCDLASLPQTAADLAGQP